MDKPTYEELINALRNALHAMEKGSPAKAGDWPAQESAEKEARELLARAA